MSKKERISEVDVINFLKAKRGYLKKSASVLGHLLGVSEKVAQNALKCVKNELKERSVIASPSNISKFKAFRSLTGSKVYGEYSIKKQYNLDNVLVISDTHFPFEKEGYLEHCIKIREKYNCGTIVHIGDEVDLCGVSQWEKDPDGFSPGTEASLAQEKMKIWYRVFPEVFVCIGNHTARPFRMAKSNGIPKKFIKSYEEAWEAPKGWKWAENWEFNGVLYTHGTGFSGPNAAITIATRHRQNTVIGHIHSQAGIQYSASKIDLVWGMQVGGALDDGTYAAYYAKDQLKKSIVGCGVVLDGKLPVFEPMIL